MKQLIMITAFLMCFVGSAQQKKPKKIVPPPPVKEVLEPPKIEAPKKDDSKKCFSFTMEEKRDSLVYVTETLLEYGWNSDLARIIITSYDYDPIKKKEAKEAGYDLVQAETMQFIDGVYKIENGTFTFTPDKLDRFITQLFKITYKPKAKEIEFLIDEDSNKLQPGECLQPMVMMSM